MSAPRRYFMLLCLKRWAECEVNIGLPMEAKMPDGSIGYVPVFETREEAEAEQRPGQIIQEIQEVTK